MVFTHRLFSFYRMNVVTDDLSSLGTFDFVHLRMLNAGVCQPQIRSVNQLHNPVVS
jgi:hypothetical protein